MSRFSISNSNFKRCDIGVSASVGFALAIFALTSLAMHRVPERVLVEADSVSIRNMKTMQSRYATQGKASPRVLISGSSRFIEMDESAIALNSGIEEEAILNLSTPGVSPFFIESFLRRHPEVVSELDVIVIDLLPYMLMHSMNFREDDTFFHRYASLTQRLHARSAPDRILAVADYGIPVLSHSQTPDDWRRGIERFRLSGVDLDAAINQRSLFDFPGFQKLIQDMREQITEDSDAMSFMAQRFYPNIDVAMNQVEAVTSIIELVPDDCTVLLVWLPISDASTDVVARQTDLSDCYDIFESTMNLIRSDKLHTEWVPNAKAWGLTQKDYSDDGFHFSRRGHRVVEVQLGQLIRKHVD